MQEKPINLIMAAPEGEKPPVIAIEWREGKALEVNNPKSWTKTVSVASIAAFVAAKGYADNSVENKGVVFFSLDPDNATLQFLHDPTDPLAHSLFAKMEKHPDFLSFGINEDEYFTQKELEKQVKKFAHCFADINVARDLITRLQNFTVKYEQTIEKKDNRQGETKNLVETAIKFAEGELPKKLQMRCPLYKHTEPVSFEVEIEIEKGPNNTPTFGFYSLDLGLLIREVAVNAISKEVNILRDYFAVLEV